MSCRLLTWEWKLDLYHWKVFPDSNTCDFQFRLEFVLFKLDYPLRLPVLARPRANNRADATSDRDNGFQVLTISTLLKQLMGWLLESWPFVFGKSFALCGRLGCAASILVLAHPCKHLWTKKMCLQFLGTEFLDHCRLRPYKHGKAKVWTVEYPQVSSKKNVHGTHKTSGFIGSFTIERASFACSGHARD